MKHNISLLSLLLAFVPAYSFAQSGPSPLSRSEILGRLAVGYSPSYIARLVQSRGTSFSPSEHFLSAVKSAGGDGILVERLSSSDSSRSPKAFSDPDGSTDLLARCAELIRSGAFAPAEKECRAAIDENPQSPWPTLATLRVLEQSGAPSDERIALLHHSVTLAPDLPLAHKSLSIADISSEERDSELQKLASLEGAQVEEAQAFLSTSQTEADYRDRAELEPFSPEVASQLNSEIDHILQTAPDLACSHLLVAHYFQSLGNLEKTRSELHEALRIEPGNPGIHYALGYFYQSQHDVEEELAEFREAVRLVPYGTLERQSLVDSLLREGRLDEAIAEWRNLLALSPGDLRASNALVQLYLQQNDRKSAITELRHSLKVSFDASPDEVSYANARFQDIDFLAVLLTENREFDAAAALYALLLRHNPDSAYLHNNFANVLFAERRFSEAILEYRAALRFQPDISSVHHNLAVSLAAQHDLDGAISEYRLALDKDPDETNSRLSLGVALGQKGDLNAAMNQFQLAIAKNPADAAAHTHLAHAFFLNNDSPSAIAELHHALELKPNFPAAENELAWIYATSVDPHYRNPAAALSLVRHAAQSAKEPAPAFLDTLAEALLVNGQPFEALETEQQAATLAPDDLNIQSRLSRFQQAALSASSSHP
jgi:tetratricopeptide (TPR) repeat protein